MSLKSGLNVNDMNTLRRGLQQGLSIDEIARACRVSPLAMKRYADSLNKKKREKVTKDVDQN